jgi:energy-coupling factor transporter ATP-binding protein EcfA2
MLASTHDMELVRELFPRTIVMDEGLISADGKIETIFGDEALI